LRQHLETALQSAWYEVMREIYNQQIPVDRAWQAAAWWSVRVLCYSGMFRFSSKGLFNVPYGGISYNARNFNDSMDNLFGERRVKELARFTIESRDFQALMAAYQGFTASDFLFIDPPYDSTFSQYNVEGDFVASDQERLRDALEASSAKWMVVIKRTDFIQGLYDKPGHHCYVFDKSYAVNFRNRHDRGVQHLVVTNYPLTLNPEGEALRPLAQADVPPSAMA
jgi:DNA adenine methylase